jgi:hypothetical protein
MLLHNSNMAAVYRMATGGPRGPPGGIPPVAAAPGPAPYVGDGYRIEYDFYANTLKPILEREYSRGERRDAPVAAAAAPGADPVPIELTRIKAYLNDAANPTRKPAGWDSGRLNGAVNRARDSPAVTALGAAVPFDVNAYRVAILASLNANAPPGFNYRGVGP